MASGPFLRRILGGDVDKSHKEEQVIIPCVDLTPLPMKAALRQLIGCATSKRLGLKDIRMVWPNAPSNWPLGRRALLMTAREMLLGSLQNGLLNATGRLSRRPANPHERRDWGRAWIMHSSRQSLIPAKAWRDGCYDWRRDALELPDCHYIEIQLLKVLVEALWPDFDSIDSARTEADARRASEMVHATPYLKLMQQAIDAFRLGEGEEPKKEVLVDWFRARHIAGQQVSSNMARYLATFVRQPETQRGGNRKWSSTSSP